MKANINIATLNVNGLTALSSNMNSQQKWSTINSTLNRHKLAIVALQETHLDQHTVDRLHQGFGGKMDILFSADPHSPRSMAGVAFVIVTMAYALGSQTNHVTPGSPRYAEGEPANLIDASSPVQLYRTT